jgi:hypothetical protein
MLRFWRTTVEEGEGMDDDERARRNRRRLEIAEQIAAGDEEMARVIGTTLPTDPQRAVLARKLSALHQEQAEVCRHVDDLGRSPWVVGLLSDLQTWQAQHEPAQRTEDLKQLEIRAANAQARGAFAAAEALKAEQARTVAWERVYRQLEALFHRVQGFPRRVEPQAVLEAEARAELSRIESESGLRRSVLGVLLPAS